MAEAATAAATAEEPMQPDDQAPGVSFQDNDKGTLVKLYGLAVASIVRVPTPGGRRYQAGDVEYKRSNGRLFRTLKAAKRSIGAAVAAMGLMYSAHAFATPSPDAPPAEAAVQDIEPSQAWTVGVADDPLEGLMAVSMESPVMQGDRGNQWRMVVRCEKNDAMPKVMLATTDQLRLKDDSFRGNVDLRMRLDQGDPFDQAMLPTKTRSALVVSSEQGRGPGPLALLDAARDSDKLLVAVNHNAGREIVGFDLTGHGFERGLDKVAQVCPPPTRAAYVRDQNGGSFDAAHAYSAGPFSTPDVAEIPADTRVRCGGTFGRNTARIVGGILGGLVGKAVGDNDGSMVAGAVLGGAVAGDVDRRLENSCRPGRRAERRRAAQQR